MANDVVMVIHQGRLANCFYFLSERAARESSKGKKWLPCAIVYNKQRSCGALLVPEVPAVRVDS